MRSTVMRSSGGLVIAGLFLATIGTSVLAQTVVVTPEGAGNQPRLGFRGIHVELGIADPDKAKSALQFGGELDLGTIFTPWLHLTPGASYWSTDIERSNLGGASGGTLSDLTVHADLRWRSFRIWRLRPYMFAGVAGHIVGADIPGNPSLEDALSGTNLGVDFGMGLARSRHGFRYGVEVRRRIVNDVDGWAFTAGFGWALAQPGPSRSTGSQTTILPMTATAAAPVSAMPAAPTNPELVRATRLMEELIAQNRSLRAELDSLRRETARPTRATAPPAATQPWTQIPPPAAATPSTSSVAPPTSAGPSATPAPPGPDPREELHRALQQVAERAGKPSSVREEGDDFVLSLPGAFLFDVGQSTLQVAAREAIRRVALVMLRDPDVELIVEGHADAWGDPAANQKLSEARAMSVAQEVVTLGVEAARVGAIGYGDTRPIADNSTAAGRALNRRVELRFSTTEPAPKR